MNYEPAFPHLISELQRVNENELYPGLSKRELFAAMAMQGWIHALAERRGEPSYSDKDAAIEAARLGVWAADALLNELAKAGER